LVTQRVGETDSATTEVLGAAAELVQQSNLMKREVDEFFVLVSQVV
jgi:hypothetical protein